MIADTSFFDNLDAVESFAESLQVSDSPTDRQVSALHGGLDGTAVVVTVVVLPTAEHAVMVL